MDNMVSKGRHYEDMAAEYLIEKGYEIKERNYTVRGGEIDIIAEKGMTLCFVEVKSQASDAMISPFERITKKKMRNIIYTTKKYLQSKRISNRFIRFDVIGIVAGKITHMEDAFRE